MAALAIVHHSSLAARIQEVESISACLDALDRIDELSHEEYADLQDQLARSIYGTREKIDAVASMLADFEAAATAAANEAARLAARKQRFERHAERLRMYVLESLAAANRTKIEGFTCTLAARENPPRVVIDSEGDLPATFFRIPPTPAPAPDKTAIANELKRGIVVPGARLVRTQRLVVS